MMLTKEAKQLKRGDQVLCDRIQQTVCGHNSSGNKVIIAKNIDGPIKDREVVWPYYLSNIRPVCDIFRCEDIALINGFRIPYTGIWHICEKHQKEFENGEHRNPKMKPEAMERERSY